MKQVTNTKTTFNIEQLSKLKALFNECKTMKTNFDRLTYGFLEQSVDTAGYAEHEKRLTDEMDYIRDIESKIKYYFHKVLSIQTDRDSLIPGANVDLNQSFGPTSVMPKLHKIALIKEEKLKKKNKNDSQTWGRIEEK